MVSLPSHTDVSHFMASEATIVPKKAIQVRRDDQCVDTSSIPKSTPPIGASKAAATPAAAPMATKSRWSRSSSRTRPCVRTERKQSSERMRLCALSTMHEIPAPSCTIGPSRPHGSPDATTSVTPSVLTARVIAVRAPGTRTPLSSALTIGIPEPAAAGAKLTVSAHAHTASSMQYREKTG